MIFDDKFKGSSLARISSVKSERWHPSGIKHKEFWSQTLKLASPRSYFYLSIKAYLGVLTKKIFKVSFYILCLYLHLSVWFSSVMLKEMLLMCD